MMGIYVGFVSRGSLGPLVYIGSGRDIQRRISQHRSALKRGAHFSEALQEAYNQYRNITFGVVEVVAATSELVTREQHHLDAAVLKYGRASIANASLVVKPWSRSEVPI